MCVGLLGEELWAEWESGAKEADDALAAVTVTKRGTRKHATGPRTGRFSSDATLTSSLPAYIGTVQVRKRGHTVQAQAALLC